MLPCYAKPFSVKWIKHPCNPHHFVAVFTFARSAVETIDTKRPAYEPMVNVVSQVMDNASVENAFPIWIFVVIILPRISVKDSIPVRHRVVVIPNQRNVHCVTSWDKNK